MQLGWAGALKDHKESPGSVQSMFIQEDDLLV